MKKLFKVIVAGAILLSTQFVNAQFKFSKVNITDGSKTTIKAGEKYDLKISPNGTVQQNYVVDIDIAACRSAYKYDIITVAYVKGG